MSTSSFHATHNHGRNLTLHVTMAISPPLLIMAVTVTTTYKSSLKFFKHGITFHNIAVSRSTYTATCADHFQAKYRMEIRLCWGSAWTLLGELTAPPGTIAGGRSLLSPPKNPIPACRVLHPLNVNPGPIYTKPVTITFGCRVIVPLSVDQ